MKKKSTYQFNFIDNQGTSMIELLVVMAIMAVLLGTATNIVGYLSGKQAKQCAYKMDAILSETRMETMSKSTGEKDSVYITIKNENGKIYAVQKIKDNEKSTLLGNSVKIVARDMQGSEMELGNGTSFKVYFNRATGALYDEANNYCEMRISQGKTTYVVAIEPTTGKIFNERE